MLVYVSGCVGWPPAAGAKQCGSTKDSHDAARSVPHPKNPNREADDACSARSHSVEILVRLGRAPPQQQQHQGHWRCPEEVDHHQSSHPPSDPPQRADVAGAHQRTLQGSEPATASRAADWSRGCGRSGVRDSKDTSKARVD